MSALAYARTARGGVLVKTAGTAECRGFFRRIEELGIADCLSVENDGGDYALSLRGRMAAGFESDATGIARDFGLRPAESADDLEREIVLSMLLAPFPVEYPSFAELTSSVRMRMNVVTAARRTQLAFDTESAERPAGYWTYGEDRGFTIIPGQSLISGLEKATQPDVSGKLYSFSCYRATEYVVLLAIAHELARSNPRLMTRLQAQWETKAIKSGAFHEAFLYEYGTMQSPVPMRYYIPGDRVWFRNPDVRSSDIAGFEGSWVFYLGDGLFSNFWHKDKPYTLASKCIEIYHWRHGACRDAAGGWYMDENEVARRVADTMESPNAVAAALGSVMKHRDPSGVYADGGCIDATREFPRWVRPGTATICLPDAGNGALRLLD